MDNAAGYHSAHPELVEGCIPGNRKLDTDLERRIQRRVDQLPPKLQAHIARAQDVARELAPYHKVPPEQAALGILAHDVARAMSGAELLHCAAQFALPVGMVDRRVPVLLHGPVGAEILRREEGLTTTAGHLSAHPELVAGWPDSGMDTAHPELVEGWPGNGIDSAHPELVEGWPDNGMDTGIALYQAVYWHTTAHPDLDAMGKVVFLADKLDPNKLKKYPYQPRIMELARENLDAAILEFLTRQIIDLTGRGLLVHPMMVKARNALLATGLAG